jgi:tryptophanyl-tRNA synthetase
MCGECKQEAASLVKEFMVQHKKKRTAMMKDAQQLLAKSRRFLLSSGK